MLQGSKMEWRGNWPRASAVQVPVIEWMRNELKSYVRSGKVVAWLLEA